MTDIHGIGPSLIVKRSVVLGGAHKTSVSLEDPFWDMLYCIKEEKHTTLKDLINEIDHTRSHGNLSSAIRLYVLKYALDKKMPAPSNFV